MSQVGDKAMFAIDWQINWIYGTQVHGNLCFWAHTRQIGDYENDVLLSASIAYLIDFLSHKGERRLAQLEGTAKEEIFAILYESSINIPRPGETEKQAAERLQIFIPESMQRDWSFHSRARTIFHLDDIGGSAFDTVSIILIEDRQLALQRLIWHEHTSWVIDEVGFPDATFDVVAEQFIAQYAIEVNQR